jgi:(p)ppGpp synthase/HD superfamily hydrolase
MLFAMEKHSGQKRKYTGEPYWKHLAEVAALVQTTTGVTDEMVMAAWLHDTLEDTETTADEIKAQFGATVMNFVVGLSDVSSKEDGNRASRKAADRNHIAEGGKEIQTIKVADTISNTSSIVENDPAFAKIYLKEKRELLQVLVKADPALVDIAIMTLIHSDMNMRYAAQ